MSRPIVCPPLVYLVLGAAGSGRREVVADLIEAGLAEGERAAVLLSEKEGPDPADARLGPAARWRRAHGGAIEAGLPPGATQVFFVADGRENPIDQIEAFKAWLEAQPAALARVLCVVDCGLAERNPPLLAWFEACIHFSDVVLLNRREGVPHKWIVDFEARFKGRFYPCLFEPVKAGKVDNPALILEPRALRLTQIFDEEEKGAAADEDEEAEPREAPDGAGEDPYFARRPGGRRAREIPDIAPFLVRPLNS